MTLFTANWGGQTKPRKTVINHSGADRDESVLFSVPRLFLALITDITDGNDN